MWYQNMQNQTEQIDQKQRNPVAQAFGAFFGYWIVSWLLVPAAMVLVLHYFVFSAFHVVGTSMLPTLQDSDYLIVSKVQRTGALLAHEDYIPGRGQTIVFHYPKQPDLDFVKRVVALPGERVVVRNCNVTVYNRQSPNGITPDVGHEIYGTCTQGDIDESVPAGNIFVLGNNRTPGGSSDSREWGYLPSHDIIGNVVARLYPFGSVRAF